MKTRRYTQAGTEKATKQQISRARELAAEAGYTGDTAYNAAQDLLGEGRGWSDTPEAAARLISALEAKISK